MTEELQNAQKILDEMIAERKREVWTEGELNAIQYLDKLDLLEIDRILKAFDKQKERPIQCPGCKIWINLGEKYFKHLLEEE